MAPADSVNRLRVHFVPGIPPEMRRVGGGVRELALAGRGGEAFAGRVRGAAFARGDAFSPWVGRPLRIFSFAARRSPPSKSSHQSSRSWLVQRICDREIGAIAGRALQPSPRSRCSLRRLEQLRPRARVGAFAALARPRTTCDLRRSPARARVPPWDARRLPVRRTRRRPSWCAWFAR